MGEYPQAVGRDFVDDVYAFIDKKYGFSVIDIAYWAPRAATIQVGSNFIHFDMFMQQERESSLDHRKYKLNYICECKSRRDATGLLAHFREFVIKIVKTYDESVRKYDQNFFYLFITNREFGVWDEEARSIEYLRDLLGDDSPSDDRLVDISGKLGVLVLSNWFLETAMSGVV